MAKEERPGMSTQPRSGETTLATGVSPWYAAKHKASPVGTAQTRSGIVPSLRDWILARFSFHGLTPVARIVSPLRGCATAVVLIGLLLPTLALADSSALILRGVAGDEDHEN